MNRGLTRRQFLGGAGTGLAGAAFLGTSWKAISADLERRNNIVLIIIDNLRADHLGCYGNPVVRTPNMDALARESVRFTRVFPEAMPTVPGRRSIMTGRRVFPFRGWRPWYGLGNTPGWRPILPGTETLTTLLRDTGYRTGYVSDNPFLSYAPGFGPFRASHDRYLGVFGQITGEKTPVDVSVRDAERWLPEPLRDPGRIAEMRSYLARNGHGEDDSETAVARVFATAEWLLRRFVTRRPFFLVVDAFDPHEPWTPPRKYIDLYGDPDYRGPEIGDIRYGTSDYLTDDQVARLGAIYKGSVTMVDRWLGRFLELLDHLNLDNNTVIALVSDHGIHLGDHGWIGKSAYHLQSSLSQVPLLVRAADERGAGTTSDYFANTIDLAPTLMSLAGVPVPEHFDGVDLSAILEGREPPVSRPFTYGGYSNQCFVRDDRWMMIASNLNTGHMLFDLSVDPGETRNVASENPVVLRDLWDKMVGAIGRPPSWYSHDQISAEPRRLTSG